MKNLLFIFTFLLPYMIIADPSASVPVVNFSKPTLTNNAATPINVVAYRSYKQVTADNVDGRDRINKVGLVIPEGGVINFPEGTVEFDVWYGSRDAISTILAGGKSYTVVPSADKWSVELDDKFR